MRELYLNSNPNVVYSFPRLHLRSAYDTIDEGLYVFSKYVSSFPAPPGIWYPSLQQNRSISHSCFLSNLHFPNVIKATSSFSDIAEIKILGAYADSDDIETVKTIERQSEKTFDELNVFKTKTGIINFTV